MGPNGVEICLPTATRTLTERYAYRYPHPQDAVFVENFARTLAPVLLLVPVCFLFMLGRLTLLHGRMFRLRLTNSTSRDTVRTYPCGMLYDEFRCCLANKQRRNFEGLYI